MVTLLDAIVNAQWLMHKIVNAQNDLSNVGTDPLLKGANDGRLNVGLEWAP